MVIDTYKSVLKTIHYKQFVLASMCLSFIWPLQFISQLNISSELSSIDASWMLALSNAWEQQRIWGDEIIFTYGPLAFLSTRVLATSSSWQLLLFDFYFAASFVYILYNIFHNAFSWRKAAVILATCFFYKQAMVLSLVFTLQLIAILYLNEYTKNRKIFLLAQAIVITTLIFFIKLNMAFVSILIFMMYTLYLHKLKALTRIHLVLTLISLLVTILLVSLILPIDLLKYITTGTELILSYSDAVYVYPKSLLDKGLSGIVLSVFFIGIIFILKEFKYHSSEYIILCCIFILLLFVLFKQSYVRADLEHLKDFFYCVPPCILVFIYVSKSKLAFIQFPILLLWVVGIGISILFNDYFYPMKKIISFPVYAYSYFNQPDYDNQLFKRELPTRIKEKIGIASVDVIPWESSLAILNKLNYSPRPLIQSYQAYNEVLDKINATVYDWQDAPQFVMYNTNSIDQHYNFFDDTHLKKALYCRYDVVDTFTCSKEEMILFSNMGMRKQCNFIPVVSGTISLRDVIPIPRSLYPLMAKIKMKYSWIGEFQKFFLRTPYSEITMSLNNSSTVNFQTATTILEAGVFIDRYVNTRKDALQFFTQKPVEKNRIEHIQLHVANEACWDKTIEYEWYELR